MSIQHALRALSALFSADLQETKVELKKLVQQHPGLEVCDTVYSQIFDEIIRAYPHYTKEQFELLLLTLEKAIKTSDDLYEQFHDTPRLACVILMKRFNYLSNLLFLKETARYDITTFTLNVDKVVCSRTYNRLLFNDYKALMQRLKKPGKHFLFPEYHIDPSDYGNPPSVACCREMFTQKTTIPKVEFLPYFVEESDQIPLLNN